MKLAEVVEEARPRRERRSPAKDAAASPRTRPESPPRKRTKRLAPQSPPKTFERTPGAGFKSGSPVKNLTGRTPGEPVWIAARRVNYKDPAALQSKRDLKLQAKYPAVKGLHRFDGFWRSFHLGTYIDFPVIRRPGLITSQACAP